MAREPQRREQPAPLDAKLVPVQRALIARAKALEAYSDGPFLVEGAEGEVIPMSPQAAALVRAALVHEFRALADELGHW